MEDRYLRYNHLNQYYKKIFGERTLKICINGGFTCPNRDGTKSYGGCIFCSEQGSGEHLKNISISDQVLNHLNSYRGQRANKFIVYFQNFTNTYDTIDNLKKKYNSALIDERIVGLEIATRPDCINEKIAELIHSYSKDYYVCVELGLQTANDKIGKLLNRQYSTNDFITAVNLLKKYNKNIVSHIMVGLPNETDNDIYETVNLLNKLDINGVKIHSTYIIQNTELNNMFNSKTYFPMTFDYYMEKLVFIITHLNKDIIIHRISGDAPKELLIAPEWNLHKKQIMNGLDKILRERNLYQGCYINRE